MRKVLQNLYSDLRFALRQLRRSPGFAVTAMLTLALGIGAATAIFSLLDQALLRSLPVKDPGSLVVLEGTGKAWEGSTSVSGGSPEAYFSYPMYRDLATGAAPFDGLLATAPGSIGFVHANRSQVADAELVSGNYFHLLGVQPAVGRVFTQAEDLQPGAVPVAVLSFNFWKDQLGADPAIAGQTVSINGHPFQIVGVAAAGFHSAVWGQTPGVFVPMSMLDQVLPGMGRRLTSHKDRWLNIAGRLKPGVTRAQAQVEVESLWHALRAEELKQLGTQSPRFQGEFLTNSRLHVLPGARGFSYSREGLQTPFLAVMAMAVLLLLVAAVNVASLLLVRSAGRTREFSLRSALGASSARLVSQLMLEGLLIGLCGGAAGLLIAPALLRVLVSRLGDPDSENSFTATLDWRVLLFNFGVAVLVSLCFSLAPALRLRRPDLTATLREGSSTGAGSLLNLRRFVVCLQIGFSVILLVASALFLRTIQQLRTAQVGFNTAHLVTFSINPRLAGYSVDALPALQQRLLAALAAVPGVQMVAATNDQVLANNNQQGNVTVAGYTAGEDEQYDVEQPVVSSAYFELMQTPLVAGRAFTDDDNATHSLVTVVNQAFSKHFCGGPVACLGRMMMSGGGTHRKLDTQIIGIVRDSKHAGIRADVTPTFFRPLRQLPKVMGGQFYLRTYADPVQMVEAVRRTMQQFDPALAVSGLMTMDQRIERDLSNDSMIALLAASFGALATFLAGIGIYGVLAYSTAQRTREIGIRMALGSTRLAASQLVLTDVLKLAALGILVAIPLAVGLSHTIRSQLYGVSVADPFILCSVTALIALVALLAGVVPAYRAASVEPTTALRTE